MANSVEARVPYLDHRVVELLHHVPAARKSAPGETKLVLRQACSDLIPRRIARRAKFPFNTPSEWLLTADPDGLSDLLSETSLRDAGLFEPAAVRTLHDGVRRHAGRRDSMLQVLRCQVLVGVVTTQILHRLFVDTA
jgi:asparagine synthase (glutamine-hydrolysing)